MLFLLFQLGTDTYALDTGQVAEILPLVSLKSLPGAPAGVAGMMNCRGQPVPVIDLSRLVTGRPAPERLSTRIILVNYPGADGQTHLLGLIAENATATMQADARDFAPSGVTAADAPYLGPVVAGSGGLIQRLDLERLLPAPVRESLFKQTAAS